MEIAKAAERRFYCIYKLVPICYIQIFANFCCEGEYAQAACILSVGGTMPAVFAASINTPLPEVVRKAILRLDPNANLAMLERIRGDDLGLVLGAVLYAARQGNNNSGLEQAVRKVPL